MRPAAVYASLIWNAAFFEFAVHRLVWQANTVTVFLGPLVWGVFLVFGVYLVPARSGMGPRELMEVQFGRRPAAVFWWCLMPLWAIALFASLSQHFVSALLFWQLPDHEAWNPSADSKIAAYWPWVILTGLAGLAPLERLPGFLVKFSAFVLLAVPFAYRETFPKVLQRFSPAGCCGEVWAMQDIVIWLTPGLLFAGRFTQSRSADVLWSGAAGIVLPLVLGVCAATVTWWGAVETMGKWISHGGNYFSAAAGLGDVGRVKLLLLALTLVGIGRFCVAILMERLGHWRRWWLVFPLTGAIAYSSRLIPEDVHWQVTGTPFLPIAGVITAGYFCRRGFRRSTSEQRLAVWAWLSGLGVSVTAYVLDDGRRLYQETAPVVGWLSAFLVFVVGIKGKGLIGRIRPIRN